MEGLISEHLELLFSLFSKQGIKTHTMDHIAKELGMSKKTLYKHVQDKDDLVYQVMFYKFNNNSCRIESELYDNDSTVSKKMIDLMSFFFEQILSTSPLFYRDLKLYHPTVYKRVSSHKSCDEENAITKMIEIGIRDGIFKENLNVNHYAKIMMSSLSSVAFKEMITDEDFKSLEFIKDYIYFNFSPLLKEEANDEFLKELNRYDFSHVINMN